MGFLETFGDMLADSITVEPFTARDADGKKTYGAAVTFKAHIDGQARILRTKDGEDRLISASVYIGPSPTVTQDDRITLPARFSPTVPPIVAVKQETDESGPHHQVILCG